MYEQQPASFSFDVLLMNLSRPLVLGGGSMIRLIQLRRVADEPVSSLDVRWWIKCLDRTVTLDLPTNGVALLQSSIVLITAGTEQIP